MAHGLVDSRMGLGALGQPIRRINTFTASLPTFAEGEEKHGGGAGGLHHRSQHSSEEDLVQQLLGAAPHIPAHVDEGLRLLSDG